MGGTNRRAAQDIALNSCTSVIVLCFRLTIHRRSCHLYPAMRLKKEERPEYIITTTHFDANLFYCKNFIFNLLINSEIIGFDFD